MLCLIGHPFKISPRLLDPRKLAGLSNLEHIVGYPLSQLWPENLSSLNDKAQKLKSYLEFVILMPEIVIGYLAPHICRSRIIP